MKKNSAKSAEFLVSDLEFYSAAHPQDIIGEL